MATTAASSPTAVSPSTESAAAARARCRVAWREVLIVAGVRTLVGGCAGGVSRRGQIACRRRRQLDERGSSPLQGVHVRARVTLLSGSRRRRASWLPRQPDLNRAYTADATHLARRSCLDVAHDSLRPRIGVAMVTRLRWTRAHHTVRRCGIALYQAGIKQRSHGVRQSLTRHRSNQDYDVPRGLRGPTQDCERRPRRTVGFAINDRDRHTFGSRPPAGLLRPRRETRRECNGQQ